MPPRGWKKKDSPVEEKKSLPEEKVEKPIIRPKLKESTVQPKTEEPKISIVRKRTKLPPPIQSIQNDRQYAQIVISWTDDKGRLRTTRYTMADLNVNESVNEEFTGSKKKTRISLSIEGNVLEKL